MFPREGPDPPLAGGIPYPPDGRQKADPFRNVFLATALIKP